MKIAILLITFDRPNYLKETLWGLRNADLSKVSKVLIVDNNSSDAETKQLLTDCAYDVAVQPSSNGISTNLLAGYEMLFKDHDIVINLDSDALVRPDFIDRLLELYQPNTLLTGFHSTTENRHKVKEWHYNYCIKESVGGINFCIDKQAYANFVKPALLKTIPHGNWDHQACLLANGVMCAVPSLIQHIGINSSLGHHDNPDIADDFYYWDLPDVTLFGVDNNKTQLDKAKDICTKMIKFGDVVSLNPNITSKEEYSKFIIKETYKHVSTSHVLIFQHDGFIHNWKAWDSSWLQYDYIGAPWWYRDGHDVGNGGFSLRSKRLMEVIANDEIITEFHPEDHVLCRVYRNYLEKTYNIKFAPLEVAERFAYEGYRQPDKKLTDQFGVHGKRNTPVRQDKYVFNQFLSLGDILFLIPMARALMNEGNTVLWPIDARYLPIKKHFLDINFVDKALYDLPYESRSAVMTPYGKLLPYRFASENTGLTLRYCMEAKYRLYNHDPSMWRELTWRRDYAHEATLIELLNLPEKFNLVNRTFGHEASFTITPVINNDYPIVEMTNIPGYTLIDWLGVVERATEIHASNSSLNYLIELMNLDCLVYLYPRKIWGEKLFEYTSHLFKNKCFRFVENEK